MCSILLVRAVITCPIRVSPHECSKIRLKLEMLKNAE